MKKQEVYAGLRDILCEKFKLDKEIVKPKATLGEDLGLDSVEVMDALCLFEEVFKVEIIEGAGKALVLPDTVDGLADLITARLNKRLAK